MSKNLNVDPSQKKLNNLREMVLDKNNHNRIRILESIVKMIENQTENMEKYPQFRQNDWEESAWNDVWKEG